MKVTKKIYDIMGQWRRDRHLAKYCDIAKCKNRITLNCPSCDLNVCDEHSMKGTCIYCQPITMTPENIKIFNQGLDCITIVDEDMNEIDSNKYKIQDKINNNN